METKHKTFQPYDRVLVRDSEDKWQIDFYSHWNNDYKQHITLAYGDGLKIEDADILPYEGNETLLGSTQEPEEEIELEEREWIMVCNFPGQFEACWSCRQFKLLQGNKIYVINKYEPICENYMYAIRFSDFNPNDMEETRKHILCVKDGKVVRYKE